MPIVFVLILAAIVATGGWWWFVPDRVLQAWMKDRDIPVTDQIRQVVDRELRRARRWRSTGVAVGILVWGVPNAVGWMQGTDLGPLLDWYQQHASPWVVVLIGYLVGALGAELTATRPATPRHTSIAPRDVADYLSLRLHRALIVLPVALVVLLPLPLVLPVEPSWPTSPRPVDLAAGAIGGVVALMLAELAVRRIVHRPQRLSDPALIRADDALRSSAAHAVTAAAVALQLLALGSALWTLGRATDPTLLRWALPCLAIFAILAAFSVWANHGITTFRWTVHRLQERTS